MFPTSDFHFLSREKGISVAELLCLILFMSILAALVIPWFARAREVATQKCTMNDMVRWAEAIHAYTRDHAQPPSNPRGRLNYKKQIIQELLSYINGLRIVDWWGYPYQIWIGEENELFRIPLERKRDFIIVSTGKKGAKDGWAYDPDHPFSGLYPRGSSREFENDIVLWNTRFIHGPQYISLEKRP